MERDKDNDGYLSESELPEQLRRMLGRAAADGDKKLYRDEIIALINSRVQQMQRGTVRGGGGARRGNRPPRDTDDGRPPGSDNP